MPWLPAASHADLEALMRLVVEQWLADWIVGPVGVDIAIAAPTDGVSGDWRGAQGRWLQGGGADVIALGLAACNGQADRVNPVDRNLLECVGEDMLKDLLARLGAGQETGTSSGRGLAGPECSRPEGARHAFRVTASPGEWSLRLALDEHAVTRLRKAAAGSSRTPDLTPLSVALAGEEVRLGCHLGSAGITAGELSALAAGDVLVLDRRLDAPVPLTIEGNLSRTGQARIGAQTDAIQVTLTEEIDLMRGI